MAKFESARESDAENGSPLASRRLCDGSLVRLWQVDVQVAAVGSDGGGLDGDGGDEQQGADAGLR